MTSRPLPPVRRPRHGKALLVAGVGITVQMTGCPFVAANLVAFPPPPVPQCTPADDPSLWLIGSATGTNPVTLTLTIQTFQVSGVELANQFDVDGGVLQGAPQFDRGSLAASTSVTLTIQPNPGVPNLTLRTGATCSGVARALLVRVDLVSFGVTVVPAP